MLPVCFLMTSKEGHHNALSAFSGRCKFMTSEIDRRIIFPLTKDINCFFEIKNMKIALILLFHKFCSSLPIIKEWHLNIIILYYHRTICLFLAFMFSYLLLINIQLMLTLNRVPNMSKYDIYLPMYDIWIKPNCVFCLCCEILCSQKSLS